MQNQNIELAEPSALTHRTQEIVVTGFNPAILQTAVKSLTQPVEEVGANLSLKNWDTSKRTKFERAVYLGASLMPAFNESTGEEKQLETVFFMDAEFNIWYKAAYQFVKAVKMLPIGTNFTAEFLGVEKIGNGNKAETFCIKQLQIVAK
jgi:hypothetical protein